ncbi:MBOAT family O-acyltransferase [Arsenicibacter rosenii]|uniref:Membrane-bound O-acyltransferase family protein n=1 Tax=Arsenicibacter rosenii TaxID=1750698 RepID=A0A1S2VE83_9BACT|nr:MBOAT family O-acyltransferase [Arsenicibacter rosenii]OIN56730.1 membrane-bound O-acyltransferase family protein [Arsenicibacter rosenii]
MLFSSALFLFLYLPVFLIIYFILPGRWKAINLRNAFLFIASLIFYAWGEGLIVLILLLSAFINFIAGKLIEKGNRKGGLWLSLLGSLSLLFCFKYTNFTFDTIQSLAVALHLPVSGSVHLAQIALPIGISFYTFQGISYTLDIYWGRIRANKSFLDYGTYVAMFPHQIAGPIVRYADIAPELDERVVTIEKFGVGVERFIIGLAKKMLLANTFAVIADKIFGVNLNQISTATAWLGIVSYSLQIYFDFSGYSDMAIGLGKMVGFDFKENFNYPYISRSIQEFWRRWHISLSSWFRDYVYIPLGGNRGGEFKTYRNLLIVFFVTGLWHGASWNFIVWGVFHGLFLLIERAGLGRRLERIWPVFAHAYTLLIVLIGWVFFRAENLTVAIAYLEKMAGLLPSKETIAYPVSYFLTDENLVTFIISFIVATPVYFVFHSRWQKLPALYLREILYSCMLFGLFILSVMYMAADTYNPFIYFRF